MQKRKIHPCAPGTAVSYYSIRDYLMDGHWKTANRSGRNIRRAL